jgi:hypothetical protein
MKMLLLFLLRFAIAAPLCFVFWFQFLLPLYAHAIGALALYVVYLTADSSIQGVLIVRDGLFNSLTTIQFVTATERPTLPLAQVCTNVAPYLALVLASGGLKWKRRAAVAFIGVLILALIHLLHLVCAFVWRDTVAAHPQVPTVLGQFVITLPFLLWIILCHWNSISGLVANAKSAEGTAGNSDSDNG